MPAGRIKGKPSGTGSHPASWTRSGYSDTSGDSTPTRGIRLLADDLLVPGPDPPGLVWVGGDDLVYQPRELVPSHRGESLALDDHGRRVSGLEDGVQHVLSSGARDGAAFEEIDQFDQVSRLDLRLGDAHSRLVEAGAG